MQKAEAMTGVCRCIQLLPVHGIGFHWLIFACVQPLLEIFRKTSDGYFISFRL